MERWEKGGRRRECVEVEGSVGCGRMECEKWRKGMYKVE